MCHSKYITDKVDFRMRTITRNKDVHCMIKETVHQEDATVLNVFP